MKHRVDDGLGERRGKKEKVGFKVDRSARYLERHRKEREALTGKKNITKPKGAETTARPIRELKFDADGRRQYLLSLHKKKNERRVAAMVEGRRRVFNENKKFRQEAREEARKQYNAYAKVPILPDYTFKIPDPLAEADGPSQSDDDDDADERFDEVDEISETDASMRPDVAAVFEGQTTSNVPQRLTGLSLHASSVGGVTVDVKPLFGGHRATADGKSNVSAKTNTISSGGKNRFAGGLDFSDLSPEVAHKLEDMLTKTKGPSRMRPRIHLVKEMQKIHKIRKHSRKKKR